MYNVQKLGLIISLTCLAIGLLIFPAFSAETYKEPKTGMEFVFLKGGTFTMGTSDAEGRDKEKPARKVTVPDFYMGKHEVTFAEYDAFCTATERKKPDDSGWGRGDRPVVNVRWDDAVDFSLWLSKTTGRTFRLPSEAMWEYAARAGTTSNYWWGDDFIKGKARCRSCADEDYVRKTAPVGSFPPNPWGLYDILGNVFEWTLDNYHPNYKGAPADGSPWYENGGTQKKSIRGGGWTSRETYLRVSSRDWERADKDNNDTLGFRLIMSPEPSTSATEKK